MSIRSCLVLLVLVGVTYSLSLRATRAAEAKGEVSENPLSIETRHRLNKAHGILMVFGWLFFIPSAFLFARMLRDSFQKSKPFGLAIWFHVHRTFNIIGIVLITASFLCIMMSKNWVWAGPGSGKKFTTQVHTVAGLLSLILAWIQPFLSLLRCGPNHPRRGLFNWSHRLIGVVGFLLATVAFAIAALRFQKVWKEPVLQMILVLTPTVLLLVLSAVSYVFRNKDERDKESGFSLRLSLCFWGIGTLMTISTVLSILIAQGYKPL